MHYEYPDGELITIKKSVEQCSRPAINDRHLRYAAEWEGPPNNFQPMVSTLAMDSMPKGLEVFFYSMN